MNARILPPGMTFKQAVVLGQTGRILMPLYLAWLRTMPCDTCGKPAPSEASHVNSVKGMGTKSPDPFGIPECNDCNRNYDRQPPELGDRLERAAWYLLRAIYERRLVWNTPRPDTVEVPRVTLEYILRAHNYTGEGEPRISRVDAEAIYTELRRYLA